MFPLGGYSWDPADEYRPGSINSRSDIMIYNGLTTDVDLYESGHYSRSPVNESKTGRSNAVSQLVRPESLNDLTETKEARSDTVPPPDDINFCFYDFPPVEDSKPEETDEPSVSADKLALMLLPRLNKLNSEIGGILLDPIFEGSFLATWWCNCNESSQETYKNLISYESVLLKFRRSVAQENPNFFENGNVSGMMTRLSDLLKEYKEMFYLLKSDQNKKLLIFP